MGAGGDKVVQAKETSPSPRPQAASLFAGAAEYESPRPCGLPNPDAFICMGALGQRAAEAILRSGQDPTNYIMGDPHEVVKGMQETCQPDTVTSLKLTQKPGSRGLTLRIGQEEAQAPIALARSRYFTGEPPLDGTAVEVDCDLVDQQEVDARPMLRRSVKSKFRAFGRKVTMTLEDLLPPKPSVHGLVHLATLENFGQTDH